MDPINPIAGNPTAVSPEVGPVNQIKPEKSSSPVIWFLAILLVGLLASTGILAYQNMNLRNQISSLPSISTVLPQPSATSDVTVNWKTYTNPSKTYSFKYPEGLKSDTGAAGSGVESIRFTFIGPVQLASGRTQTELNDGYFFVVTKVGLTTQFDPKTEAEKTSLSSKENCSNVSSLLNITLAGINAFQYSCPRSNTLTYLSDGKNTYYKEANGIFTIKSSRQNVFCLPPIFAWNQT